VPVHGRSAAAPSPTAGPASTGPAGYVSGPVRRAGSVRERIRQQPAVEELAGSGLMHLPGAGDAFSLE